MRRSGYISVTGLPPLVTVIFACAAV